MTNSLFQNGPGSRTPADITQDWGIGQSTQRKKPGLYIVATPIGNLRDITLRALDILAAADVVFCEDTRMTHKLLSAFGIKAVLERCDEHTEALRVAAIIKRVKQGKMVALVSDAGTPGISDPGAVLVAACRQAGIEVFPIPGPSAALAALSVSGLMEPFFMFIGFLPSRAAARRKILQDHQALQATLIIYEASQRVAALLEDIEVTLGARRVVITRELTKMHEQHYTGTPQELRHAVDHKDFKGEVVLLIAADADIRSLWDDAAIDAALSELLKEKPLKEAVADVTAKTGLPRKTIYARALAMTQHD